MTDATSPDNAICAVPGCARPAEVTCDRCGAGVCLAHAEATVCLELCPDCAALVTAEDQTLRGLGRAIRAARQARGWSQFGLAARAGVHKATILRLESGAYTSTIATLARVAAALEMDLAIDLTPRVAEAVRRTKEGW